MSTWPPVDVPDNQVHALPRLAVDVYHVNIGTGDAAIYYLVQYPPTGVTGRPYIHRACLIDGGKKKGAGFIRRFFDTYVAVTYSWNTTQGGRANLQFPPFDSIVITHWDDDHYGGVIELLSAPIRDAWNSADLRPSTPDVNDAADTNSAKRQLWVQNYLSPFMKYKSAASNAERADRALTYLYMPYWGRHVLLNLKFPDGTGRDLWEEGGWTSRFFPHYSPPRTTNVPFVIPQNFGDTTGPDPNDTGATITTPAYLDFNAVPSGSQFTNAYDKWWIQKMCCLRAGPDNSLGSNLFTNWRPTIAQCGALKNPGAMARMHAQRLAPGADVTAINNEPPADHSNAMPFLVLIQEMDACCGDSFTTRRDANIEYAEIQAGIDSLPDPTQYKDPEPKNELEGELVPAYASIYPTGPASTLLPFGAGSSTPAAPAGPFATQSGLLTNKHIAVDHRSTAPNPASTPPLRLGAVDKAPSKLATRIPPSFAARLNDVHRNTLQRVVNTKLTNKESKVANAASIGTMVVWTNGQISHYAAGDMNWENEMKFVAWIHFGQNPFRCVRTMKVQHHGSADSTPIAMVRYLRPRTMAVSCNTNMHNHPRPELILWLYLWFNATQTARVVMREPLVAQGFGIVQSTAYPYYLARNFVGYIASGASFSPLSALQRPVEVVNYQSSMTLFGATLPAPCQVLAGFQENEASTDDDNKETDSTVVYDFVAAAWPTISKQAASARPPKSGLVNAATHTVYTGQESIAYVRVFCRPFDDGLRAVLDSTIDGYAYGVKAGIVVQDDPDTNATAGTSGPKKRKGRDKTQSSKAVLSLNGSYRKLLLDWRSTFSVRHKEQRWKDICKQRGWSAQQRPMPDPTDATFDMSSLLPSSGEKLHSIDEKFTIRRRDAAPVLEPDADSPSPVNGPALISSDVISDDQAAALTSTNPRWKLDESDAWGTFLAFLDLPIISVDADNAAVSADMLRHYLINAMGGDATAADCSLSLGLGGTAPDGISISRLSLKLGEEKTAQGNRPSLSFDTNNLAMNFAAVDSSSELPLTDCERHGLFAKKMMLAMGLSNPSTSDPETKWRVTDMLDYMGLPTSDIAKFVDQLLEKSDPTLALTKGCCFFLPNENYLTVQRMEWQLDESDVHEWLDWIPNVSVTDARLIARRTNNRAPSPDGFSIVSQTELIAAFEMDLASPLKDTKASAIQAAIDFNVTEGASSILFSASFSPEHTNGPVDKTTTFSAALAWLFDTVLQDLHLDYSGVLGWFPSIEAAHIRRIQILCDCSGLSTSVQRFSVDVEVSHDGWNDASGTPVVFLCTYTWTKILSQPHGFQAQVWLLPEYDPDSPPQIMPTYEPALALYPSATPGSRLHLLSIMEGGNFTPPAELDLSITELALSVDDRTVSFTGKLECDVVSQSSQGNLGVVLTEVDLEASFTWHEGTKNADTNSYEITLFIMIVLPPVDGSPDPLVEMGDEDSTTIDAAVQLTSDNNQKFFRLTGACDNLNLAQLGQFFPDEDRPIINEILGHLVIHRLSIQYDYGPQNGLASQFSISAILVLGPIELILSFKRNAKGWDFMAMIEASEGIPSATVEDIFKSLLGSDQASLDLVDAMPGFITNIDLAHGKASLTLHVVSVPVVKGDEPADGSLSTALIMDLPGPDGSQFELSLFQTTNKPVIPVTPAVNAKARTKRLIKVTIEDLPWSQIPKPPIVDKVSPAFDQLGFYWVHDPADQQGLTVGEVASLNQVAVVPIQYKAKSSQATTPATIALGVGWHFAVLDSGGHGTPKVLLDYLFNKPKTALDGSQAPNKDGSPKTPGVPDSGQSGDGTSKGALEKTVGTFKVTNVGIRFEEGELILFLDIIAHLGPIEFALLGFGMGLDLKNVTLRDIRTLAPKLHLAGMAIEFNQPPVTIAGMFADRSTQDMKMYVGGVALAVMPYSFMAVGAYGEIKKPDADSTLTLAQASDKGLTFKTVFIFAKLNGPLIELEVATLGGITLGFGYNSDIKFPAIEQVGDFPFISNAAGGAGSDPLDVMQKLSSTDPQTGIVTPKEGSFWLAAGLEGKAVEILDVSAVVIIEFNPYVSLGIFARASAQMPPQPTPRIACFTYVELLIAATVDFHVGAMRLEAQLSPNSFVLSPMCHLTGGFALCYWFGSNANAGDFVFTIGGFHPAFERPAHYPSPPRLAITWGIGEHLMVRGEAYFAVTPKAVMGGGALNAVFDLGLLHAYFLAHADFLMTFHPFHFIADVGVEVGVEFALELLFVTIHISVHLSADVHLEGPPFGGSAYVDFWVFGFTVPFGDTSRVPPKLSLADFETVLQQIPDADSAKNPGAGVHPLHVMSVESGRFTEKQNDTQTKQGDIWEVKRGGFVFRVQSRIPVQFVDQPDWPKDEGASTVAPEGSDFYGTPMQLSHQLTSQMHVQVTKLEDEPGVSPQPKDFHIRIQVIKQMPLSIWGKYNPDVGSGKNNLQDVLSQDKGTKALMMGASFTAPPSRLSADKITMFDAAKAASLDVFGDDSHPILPGAVTYTQSTWATAVPAANAAPPARQDAQWQNALTSWQNPEINTDSPQSQAGGANPPSQSVVNETITTWTKAFGWSDGNALVNEVTSAAGETPLVWHQFQSLYMAAPLVSVA